MFDNPELDSERWKLSSEFDVFSTYLKYVQDTEPPINFHRWSLLASCSALLGRKVYFNHGIIGKVFPNLYVVLIGDPGSRKSISIKFIKRLITKAGYDTFAADKTSKEKFLLDLEGHIDPNSDGFEIKVKNPKYDSVTANNLWGSDNVDTEPKEVFIAADELAEFTGSGQLEFYTTLGNLWDWDSEKPFMQRLKNSRSVSIFQPTISILGGTTQELFSKIFPQEAIGSGFLSRLLLIHGERSGRKIAFPENASVFLEFQLVAFFKQLQSISLGEVGKSVEAGKILTKIYENESVIPDVRFSNYSQRRFTQLLKLCVILTILRWKLEIDEEIVIEANTILTHAEFLMPKALGEFGKSKNSDVANKVLLALEAATRPLPPKEIWTYVSRDLDNKEQLMTILSGLQLADKVQVVNHPKIGFLPKKQIRKTPEFVDWKFLTQEERDLAGIL